VEQTDFGIGNRRILDATLRVSGTLYKCKACCQAIAPAATLSTSEEVGLLTRELGKYAGLEFA
jgi:hypothetical protein